MSLQLRGQNIGSDLDSGDCRIGLRHTGIGQSGTEGLDSNVAGSGDLTAALDGRFRNRAHAGKGHIGIRADDGNVGTEATHGRCGLCLRLCRVGVRHIHALCVDRGSGGVNKGLEGAVGLCLEDRQTHCHIAQGQIVHLHIGLRNAAGLGIHGDGFACRVDAGSGHGSFITGIVPGNGNITLAAIEGQGHIRGSGIAQDRHRAILGAAVFTHIQSGRNIDIGSTDRNTVQLCLIGGIQQGHCQIYRHRRAGSGKGGGIDDRLRKGLARCPDGYLTGSDGAAAVDFGGGIGACVADRHICLDTCQGALNASHAGRETGRSIGGIGSLYTDSV